MKTKHSPSMLVHALHIVKFGQNTEITAEKQIPNQFSGIPQKYSNKGYQKAKELLNIQLK